MKLRHITLTAVLAMVLILLGTSAVSGQGNQENKLPHFLFPSFREGLVVMKADKPFTTMLNYNMLEQRMVAEFNGTYRYLKDSKLIDTIYIDHRVFVPVEGIFYEILSAGKFTFYLQNRATFVSAGREVGYGVKSQSTGPNRYKRFELNSSRGEVAYMDIPADGEVKPAPICWARRDGELKKFINGKQFVKLFPEYKQVLQGFLDKENINFKSREDVTRLGKYLNAFAGEN